MSGGAVAGAASPLAVVYSICNTLQTTGAVAGVWQTITFGSDVTSVLNGIIDRPTTSRFRALFDGYYALNYNMNVYMAANQRGGTFRILKNGVTDLGINANVFSNNVPERASTASSTAFIQLAANDYIEVQANPADATVMNIKANSSFNFRLLRFI